MAKKAAAKKVAVKQAPAKKEKVCIVGCSNTKDLAPFDLADEFEFWGVNNLFLTLPDKPWTRWWEIHLIEYEDGKWLRRKQWNLLLYFSNQWQINNARLGSNSFSGVFRR